MFKLPLHLREEIIRELVKDFTESHSNATETLIDFVRGGASFEGWDELSDEEVVKDYYERLVTDFTKDNNPLWKAITEVEGFEHIEGMLHELQTMDRLPD